MKTHVRSHYRLPPTITNVDLKRYEGTWQQKLAKPFPYQTGCKTTTATYQLLKNGKVRVINKCRTNGTTKTARALAETTNPPKNTKLLVDFGFPSNLFGKGDYHILYLNPTYTRALVGTPDKQYLWLLTRKTKPANDEIIAIKKIAINKGYRIGDFK